MSEFDKPFPAIVMKKRKIFESGFTLVELLIVIALIAILSVAVLATINPIEQSNKAKVLKQHDTILTREMKHENILAQFKIRQGNIYSLAEKNFFEACTMQIQLDADIAKYNFERMIVQTTY